MGFDQTREDSFKCLEKGCSFNTGMHQNLLTHLKECHDIYSQSTALYFNNMEKFKRWKEDEEQSSCAHFSLSSGSNETKNTVVSYFSCNRSGNYSAKCEANKRKRTLKTQGSIKIDAKCIANMKACKDINSKQVTVEYCSTHYGHKKTVAYIPISNTKTLSLAQKLECGITPSRILQDCHSTAASSNIDASICSRDMLISRKDLYNIKNKFNINGVCRHQEDHKSVSMWVEELRKAGNKDILQYKARGDVCENFPRIAKDDFILIMQTKFQLQQYESLGKEVICVDSTHKTTQYDLKLTTVLCVDEWGEGVPVMWMISSKEDIPTLNVMFSTLQQQAPTIIPEYLMSDDTPVYFAAFELVFTEARTHKLLCTWHLERTWQRAIHERIKNKDLQNEVYQELRLIAHVQNVQEFHELLKIFNEKLRSNEETKEFGQYFSKEYEGRNSEWAAWARKYSLVNTNMFVEAFHKFLKHGDGTMQGKQNKRVDYLIDVLFKLEAYYVEEKVRKVEKGKVTKRIQGINARHRSSLKMKDTDYIVKKGVGESWKFEGKQYSVIKKFCPRSVCKLECSICKICVHSYRCSCEDMLYTKTICKHIHFIHQMSIKPQPSVTEALVQNSQLQDHGYANLEFPSSSTNVEIEEGRQRILKDILNQRPQVNVDRIREELNKVILEINQLKDSCVCLQTLQQVKSRLQMHILPLFAKNNPGVEENQPLPVVGQYSSNKNFDHQLRFTSRKRKRPNNGVNFRVSPKSLQNAKSRLRGLQVACTTCNLEDGQSDTERLWTVCNSCGARHHESCIKDLRDFAEFFVCLQCR